MVKRSLYQPALLGKLEKKEQKFCETFAKDYLMYLGNPKPTKKQVKEIKSMLFETEVKRVVFIDRRLTVQEKKCLFLASKGKTIKETAAILNIKFNTALEYRNSAMRKLNAVNLLSAVMLRVKYNLI